MEAAEGGLRSSPSTQSNINFTMPRAAGIRWLAQQGYTRTRLPFKWEMLQPMLFDTKANAAAQAAIGQPGAFNAMYQSLITAVLDAHAGAGIRCVLDLHNYCRYRDFKFGADGSVRGLVKPNGDLYAYTTDGSQVYTRIFATASGATLTQAHFTDFWTKAARLWKDHPGFGGYGLMNEPFNMPPPGGTTESTNGGEDLLIWPAFAKAAMDAIRAIDPAGPIYLDSNVWSGAMTLGTSNPAWPMEGTNLVYSVHMYLDAGSTGQCFDYDTEVAKGYSAGLSGPINLDTGMQRLKLAVDWAAPRGLKLALTETGMPIDDPRWEEMFRRTLDYARANNVDVYSWNGGDHWTARNAAIDMTPGWYQNATIEPQAGGPMKASFGVSRGTLFDAGPGYGTSATPLTFTVFARGSLAAPATLTVASSNGGTFSKTTLTIPAGANGQDQFTFTPASNAVTTLAYTVTSGAVQAPPARRVFSLSDPPAYASTSLPDAALAVMAKFSACKWEMGDAYSDFLGGAPAGDGARVRAVRDSGWGSAVGNAMEMLNWMNNDVAATGPSVPPLLRVVNGRQVTDHAGDTWGLWCRKTTPAPQIQPNPRNRTPYRVDEPHFIIAVVAVPAGGTGIVFQSSEATGSHTSELRFANGAPQGRIVDANGRSATLTSPTALAAGQPAVITFTSAAGAQRLRVNTNVTGSASATFAATPTHQLLIGMGYTDYYPRDIFNGQVYAVVTGKGAPSAQELAAMERYLGSLAGLAL